MRSVIRNTFQKDIPNWISAPPKVDLHWNACRRTLEGHGDWVQVVAFSSDVKIVASGSYDKTVRLWDAATGEEMQKFKLNNSLFGLSFYLDSWNLRTDRGLISLKPGYEETSSSLKTSGYPITFGQDWMIYNGRRVLWLPPDFRPNRMASHHSTFALGCNPGLVYTIQFTF